MFHHACPHRNILESVLNSILVSSRIKHECFILYIHHRLTAKGVLHWKSPPLQSNSTCQIHEGDPFMCSDPPPGHQICQYGFAPLQISGFMPAVYHFINVLPVRSGLRLYHLEGTSIFVYFDCLIWYDSKTLNPKLSSNKIPSKHTYHPSARSQSQSVLYRIQLASILCPRLHNTVGATFAAFWLPWSPSVLVGFSISLPNGVIEPNMYAALVQPSPARHTITPYKWQSHPWTD